MAHYLLSHSHKLVLIARTHSALDQLHYQYGSEKVEVLAGDVADPGIAKKAVDLAIERWGRLDGLVVNHGTLDPVKKIADGSVEEWKKAYDINVFSAIGLVSLLFLTSISSFYDVFVHPSVSLLKLYQSSHLSSSWIRGFFLIHTHFLSLPQQEFISPDIHPKIWSIYISNFPFIPVPVSASSSYPTNQPLPISDPSLPPLPPSLPRPHNSHLIGRRHLSLPRLGRLRLGQSRPQPPRPHPQR